MARKLLISGEIDAAGVSTYSLEGRKSKVSVASFKKPYAPGGSFKDFIASLPAFLQAEELGELAGRIAAAHLGGKTIALAMGAHNIKVGLQPLYADLMERGVISSISLNGAGIIHDFELAFSGHSSEEVGAVLGGGEFGMARETSVWLNRVIKSGYAAGKGLGESVGEAIWEEGLPHRERSLLASAYRHKVLDTVHVALGTDIIHMHPDANGEAIGGATLRDFRRFAKMVETLEGGVYLNIGSAVILPEVFLKALTLARNLGAEVKDFTTADLDFIKHYRPGVNVVSRPTSGGGRGFRLTGPHELLVPLLFGSALEEISAKV
ncbi:MAG: hypothetical protein C0608_05710 [Deltaproteobacteria bacterium]|nr:MAG: hypothetical protein C0608_05710 [Deltaproteobacteria bacterium]